MLRLVTILCLLFLTFASARGAEPLRVGHFDVDASPPVGSAMAYDTNVEVETPLSARGIVLVGKDKPIVLCAVDWIGIGNAAHIEFRKTLAEAAGTSADRVAVHTLHQHDAPWCDFSTDELVAKHQITQRPFDTPFAHDVLARLKAAVAKAASDRASGHACRPVVGEGRSRCLEPPHPRARRPRGARPLHRDQGRKNPRVPGRHDRSDVANDHAV